MLFWKILIGTDPVGALAGIVKLICQIPGNKGDSPEYKTSEAGTNDVADAPSRICGADAADKAPAGA